MMHQLVLNIQDSYKSIVIYITFVKGGNDTLNRPTRERMFVQMLEGLHADEASLICLIKDGNLQKKYKITKACVDEAYPDIQWGNRS